MICHVASKKIEVPGDFDTQPRGMTKPLGCVAQRPAFDDTWDFIKMINLINAFYVY